MKKVLVCFVMIGMMQCSYDDIMYVAPNCPIDYSYENEIRDIIQLNCAENEACHVSGGDAPGIYESYEGLEDALKSGVFESRVLTIGDMPPFGPWPEMSPEDYEKLRCWMNEGYPEI